MDDVTPSPEPEIVEVRAFSALIDATAQSVRGWIEQGMPCERKVGEPLTRAMIDVAEARAWLEARNLGPYRAGKLSTSGGDKSQPETYTDAEFAAVMVGLLKGRAVWVQSRGCWYRCDNAGYWGEETMEGTYRDVIEAAMTSLDPRPGSPVRIPNITDAKARATLALTKSDRALCVTAEHFDADPWLLGCANGALDLHTGELKPREQSLGQKIRSIVPTGVDPKWYLTKSTTVPFERGTEAPEWRANVLRLCGGDAEAARYLQLAVGMALVGDGVVKDHGFVYILGPAGNGKSAFLRMLTAVLGPHAAVLNPRDLTERDRHLSWMMQLRGARLAVVMDMPTARLDTGKLRDLCGGDSLTANQMRGKDETWAPTHTLFAAANHPPSFGRNTQGMERRYRPIRTGPSLGAQMRGLYESELVANEGPGILWWAVEGCLAWQEQGCVLPRLGDMEDDRKSHVRDSNPVEEWLAAELESTGDRNDFISRGEARRSYATWRLDQHMGPARDGDFIDLFNTLRVWDGITEGASVKSGTHERGFRGARLKGGENRPN